ncbi:MAG: hypothetical protein KA792_08835 [Bacteroidales bacterium]|nr:hypothetical protein [Bacteroidales bacterium]
MKLIENIKNKAGLFYFKREIERKTQRVKAVNIASAKYIGLLYLVEDEKQDKFICDFVKEMQMHKKDVKALGFVKTKTIPYFCYPKLTFDYFTPKDLNWYNKPSNKFVSSFIKREFDILINLNTASDLTLHYIAMQSAAKFKVGRFDKFPFDFYNLMISNYEDKNQENFIKNILYYLNEINFTKK